VSSVVAGLQAAYAKPIQYSGSGHAPEKAKGLAAFAYLMKPFDLDDRLASDNGVSARKLASATARGRPQSPAGGRPAAIVVYSRT
jgi:hypothetical protein